MDFLDYAGETVRYEWVQRQKVLILKPLYKTISTVQFVEEGFHSQNGCLFYEIRQGVTYFHFRTFHKLANQAMFPS
jgi:maltodextrin utilization protein YvdJ